MPRIARLTSRAGRLAMFTAVLLGGVRAPLSAQVVRGTVQDATGRAVGGVVVSLLDSTSTVVGRAMSDDAGTFRLLATRAGTVRVRAQRIGFAPTLSPPIVVAAGATVTPIISLDGAQVQLGAVRVVASSACRPLSASGDLNAVWEQAHAGLTASLVTSGVRGLTTSTMAVQRVLDPGGKLLDQQLGMRSGNLTAPWASLPIDSLRQRGYVWPVENDMLVYNAPGLDGFVSPRFLDDHCLRLVTSRQDDELGVQFEPIPARAKLSEIRGTLWLSRRTAELQRAEFTYTPVPGLRPPPVPGGGSMHFTRLPNGAVIIDAWELRMPLTSSEQFGGTKTRVDQIHTTGGLIVAIRRGADTLYKRAPVSLAGVVRDSVSGQPLVGARVFLVGTQNSTTAGPDGRFTLVDVLPGQYTLGVATAAHDSLRASSGTTVLVRDSLAPLTIRVPSAAQVAQGLCGAGFAAGNRGAVVGAVTSTTSTAGLAGVSVTADWAERGTGSTQALLEGQSRRLETRTDANGAYRLCGVPIDLLLRVRAFPRAGSVPAQTVRLSATSRVATVTMAVDLAAPAVATFTGTVVNENTGTPVGDAEVSVDGAARTVRTNAQGTFRLDSVPTGMRAVSVRRLGYLPMTDAVVFAANEEEARRVVLRPTTVLDSVAVVADRPSVRLAEFNENRKLGLGWFQGREELEKQDFMRMATVLAMAPQMEIVGGQYPVTKRFTPPLRAMGRTGVQCPPPMTWSPPLREKAGGSICACYPRVYLDGILQNPTSPPQPFDLNLVFVNQLEAVEWYSSPAKLPAQFAGADTPCGALVLHTRRPGPRKEGPP